MSPSSRTTCQTVPTCPDGPSGAASARARPAPRTRRTDRRRRLGRRATSATWPATRCAPSPSAAARPQPTRRSPPSTSPGTPAAAARCCPWSARGASRLSPYIRHGLLPLPAVWAAVADAPARDRAQVPRRAAVAGVRPARLRPAGPRQRASRCARRRRSGAEPLGGRAVARSGWPAWTDGLGELHKDGWLVNQTRMWLASQWAVRAGADWREGEEGMFRHLLDGSPRGEPARAGSGRSDRAPARRYGFSRWQVEKRAPQLCRDCPLAAPARSRTGRPRRRARASSRPRVCAGGPDRRRARRAGVTGDARGGLADRRVARRRRPGAGRAPGPAGGVRLRRAAAGPAAAVRQAAGVPRRGAGRPRQRRVSRSTWATRSRCCAAARSPRPGPVPG